MKSRFPPLEPTPRRSSRTSRAERPVFKLLNVTGDVSLFEHCEAKEPTHYVGMQKFGAGHTGQKLDVLDQYHAAFPLNMQGRNRTIYIDAFAGTGRVLLSAAEERPELPGIGSAPAVLEGSAPRALRAALPYDKYVFIEKSRRKLNTLKAELSKQFAHLMDRCEFCCADANDAIAKICSETDWDKYRAVVFLDPFGNQIAWETLEAIARTKAADVWYLFPAGLGVWRQLPKQGKIRTKAAQSVTRIVGENAWMFLFTKRTTATNLFGGEETTISRNATMEAVTDYMIHRLRTSLRTAYLMSASSSAAAARCAGIRSCLLAPIREERQSARPPHRQLDHAASKLSRPRQLSN